jgi:tubulin polyglutamylase TTLL6/13
MRKHAPIEYDFFPLTWHLPSELGEFTAQFEQQKERDKSTTYIVKPEASCQGKGIFLSRRLDPITNYD